MRSHCSQPSQRLAERNIHIDNDRRDSEAVGDRAIVVAEEAEAVGVVHDHSAPAFSAVSTCTSASACVRAHSSVWDAFTTVQASGGVQIIEGGFWHRCRDDRSQSRLAGEREATKKVERHEYACKA